MTREDYAELQLDHLEAERNEESWTDREQAIFRAAYDRGWGAAVYVHENGERPTVTQGSSSNGQNGS